MKTYYIAGIPFSGDYLMHHGIKGQKWGVRRFQNSDGTYTELGKKMRRIGEGIKSVGSKVGNKIGQVVKKTATNIKESHDRRVFRKHPERMTDEELQEAIARTNMEATYREAQQRLSKASFAKTLARDIVSKAATKSVEKLIDYKFNDLSKEKDFDREQRKKNLDEKRGKRKGKGYDPVERARRMAEHPEEFSDEELQNESKRQENISKIRSGLKSAPPNRNSGNGNPQNRNSGNGNPQNRNSGSDSSNSSDDAYKNDANNRVRDQDDDRYNSRGSRRR